MLITTKPLWRRASSTSARWSSCRKPIVGTKPMRAPRARAAATDSRSALTCSTVCIAPAVVTRAASEAVLVVRVRAVAHVAREAPHRAAYVVGERRVALEELRGEAVV